MTGFYPKSFATTLGDVDGDGDLDAFMANGHTDDLGKENTVWLNNGSGRFTDSGQRLGHYTHDSRAVALSDLDGDGDLDAFVGNNNGYSTVWLNDGKGNFASNGQKLFIKKIISGRPASLGFYSHSVALGDLDGDGDLDAYVADCGRIHHESANGVIREPYNMVWLNDGAGTFSDSGQHLGPFESHAVALGDVDGDGDLDAFVANGHAVYLGEPNKVWLNDGGGRFADSGQRLGHPVFNSDDSRAVALGDLDGDGDLDAFVGNNGANEVWLNDGAGSFAYSGQALGDANTQVAILEDLDGDGDLDAFVRNSTTAKIWSNDGSGRLSDSGQDLTYSDRHVVTRGDVDGDGDLDVFAGSFDRGYQVWHNDGAGHFSRDGLRGTVFYWLASGGVIVIGLTLFCWRAIRHRRQG